ncbi:MAG: AAA family ATPase, partial [Synergistetes bacterium]|nr:AAA family ATPase [Synergistota bacterium]
KLRLSDNQKKELKDKLKKHQDREYEELRKFYRKLFIPSKEGYKEIDMGLATFGESKIDKDIYDHLRNQGEILKKISPKVIKDRYLTERDSIEVKNLYESLLKTPGELRMSSKEDFIASIKEGVEKGIFGFGYLEYDKITYKTINEAPNITLNGGEVIIRPELCKKDKKEEEEKGQEEWMRDTGVKEKEASFIPKAEKETQEEVEGLLTKGKVYLKLNVPVGKMSNIVKIINFLNVKFNNCEVKVIIKATDGKILKSEYDNLIIEALNQAEIDIEEKD